MVGMLVALRKLLKSFWKIYTSEEGKALLFLVLVTFASGTIFYVSVEGMSVVDAIYFCFVTLTTIGYGDFVPKTDFGKIFTVVYGLLGLGIMGMFITVVAKAYISTKHEKKKKKKNKSSS